MNQFFDNRRILKLIWDRKLHFVIIGLIAIILAAVFSGPAFIRPKYKSTARIYPSNLGEMSEESKTEQMLEIINSNDVKLKMISTFRIDDDYRIKKNDPKYLTYMFDIYNKNVSASKTQYETVELSAMDFYPQRASDMCDSIIHYYNLKVGEIYRLKRGEVLEILKKELDKKQGKYDTVVTNLNKLRLESGIIDYSEQVPEVTRGYMTALANGRGSSPDTKEIKALYGNMVKSGTAVYYLESELNSLIRGLDSLQNLYDVNLSEYEKNITYSHVVEKPFPADKKSFPVRWLIVLLAAASVEFMALLVFLVIDHKKDN